MLLRFTSCALNGPPLGIQDQSQKTSQNNAEWCWTQSESESEVRMLVFDARAANLLARDHSNHARFETGRFTLRKVVRCMEAGPLKFNVESNRVTSLAQCFSMLFGVCFAEMDGKM